MQFSLHQINSEHTKQLLNSDWIVFLNLETRHKVTLLRIQISVVCKISTQIISN